MPDDRPTSACPYCGRLIVGDLEQLYAHVRASPDCREAMRKGLITRHMAANRATVAVEGG